MLINVLLIVAAVLLTLLLLLFSYLDRVYQEMGRVAPKRILANLNRFEAELEPRLKLERKRAAFTFALLAELMLAGVALSIAGIAIRLAETAVHAALESVFLIVFIVILVNRFLPYVLLLRTTGEWLKPLVPVVRVLSYAVAPLRVSLEFAISVVHLAEEEEATQPADAAQAIEALVEAGKEEGLIEREDARLIESVVEFGDKIVRDLLTPRPDIVAIEANSTVAEFKQLVVEKKFSRLPVYQGTLDEVLGIVYDRDLLVIPDSEAPQRRVRELIRPVQFVPETKLVSRLLKELQQAKQQMAIVIDEYGSVAGLVTIEDLVEEIIGDIRDEDEIHLADVVKESDTSYIVRGSAPLERLREVLATDLRAGDATTVAGLVNALLGHVPQAGESVTHQGVRFEVLEANQRKVLRLRVVPPVESQSQAAPAR